MFFIILLILSFRDNPEYVANITKFLTKTFSAAHQIALNNCLKVLFVPHNVFVSHTTQTLH